MKKQLWCSPKVEQINMVTEDAILNGSGMGVSGDDYGQGDFFATSAEPKTMWED